MFANQCASWHRFFLWADEFLGAISHDYRNLPAISQLYHVLSHHASNMQSSSNGPNAGLFACTSKSEFCILNQRLHKFTTYHQSCSRSLGLHLVYIHTCSCEGQGTRTKLFYFSRIGYLVRHKAWAIYILKYCRLRTSGMNSRDQTPNYASWPQKAKARQAQRTTLAKEYHFLLKRARNCTSERQRSKSNRQGLQMILLNVFTISCDDTLQSTGFTTSW